SRLGPRPAPLDIGSSRAGTAFSVGSSLAIDSIGAFNPSKLLMPASLRLVECLTTSLFLLIVSVLASMAWRFFSSSEGSEQATPLTAASTPRTRTRGTGMRLLLVGRAGPPEQGPCHTGGDGLLHDVAPDVTSSSR